MAAWEERLNQLERNFLTEVERLKEDILGQLQINDDKYYNIDNEINTSFTSPSPSSAYTSPSTSSPSSSFRTTSGAALRTSDEHCVGISAPHIARHEPAAPVVAVASFSSTVAPASLRQTQLASLSGSTGGAQPSLTSSSSSLPPALPPQAAAAADGATAGGTTGKSRRVAPARQAAAPVVRVRAAYKFDSQEEDELPLPKGLELIAFMREVPPPPAFLSLP
jgi:hypothetical protein